MSPSFSEDTGFVQPQEGPPSRNSMIIDSKHKILTRASKVVLSPEYPPASSAFFTWFWTFEHSLNKFMAWMEVTPAYR
ncbi:hypothetical protein Hypma_006279 [Hypsizygus marmoreus]|uniref:Uncharacterized protein n=1 Tax=Hypsizygus marmoreus TaxID=39966 RepID=A0A369K0P3_HYPMA|nr:hypothetical protein Hypma_006279 [Hypsizygus marmoreus]